MRLKEEQKFQIAVLQSKFVSALEQRANSPLDFDKMFECLKMLSDICQSLKQIVSEGGYVQQSMLTAGLSSMFSYASTFKSSHLDKEIFKLFYDETMRSVMSWAFSIPPVIGVVVRQEYARETTSRFFRHKSITENKLIFVIGYSDDTFLTVNSLDDESAQTIIQESFENKVRALQGRRYTV